MDLSVIVPCYNESENIPLLLERFAEVITDDTIQVVMVDNGSTDGSADIFKELLPKYQFAKLCTVDSNKGYGFGILQGLQSADGEYIGWTHADLQTDPGDIVKALQLIKASSSPKTSYIKGWRSGRGLLDNFFSYGMGLFESIYLGTRMREINAQPNIFHRSFFESWNNPPFDFALDLYVYYTAKREKLTMQRFKVSFPERMHGESKRNTGLSSKWKFIKRTISFSRELRKSLK